MEIIRNKILSIFVNKFLPGFKNDENTFSTMYKILVSTCVLSWNKKDSKGKYIRAWYIMDAFTYIFNCVNDNTLLCKNFIQDTKQTLSQSIYILDKYLEMNTLSLVIQDILSLKDNGDTATKRKYYIIYPKEYKTLVKTINKGISFDVDMLVKNIIESSKKSC